VSNLADDAMICKRGSVLELSLAFCSSDVSDSELKHLILQDDDAFNHVHISFLAICSRKN
jgi:hypothetical protein